MFPHHRNPKSGKYAEAAEIERKSAWFSSASYNERKAEMCDYLYVSRNFMNGPKSVGKVEWCIGMMRPAVVALFGVSEVPKNDAADRFYVAFGTASGGRARIYGLIRREDGGLASAHMERDGFTFAATYVLTHRPYSGQKNNPKPRGEDASVATFITGAENAVFFNKEDARYYERISDIVTGPGFIEFSISDGLIEPHDGAVLMHNPAPVSPLASLMQELEGRGFTVRMTAGGLFITET